MHSDDESNSEKACLDKKFSNHLKSESSDDKNENQGDDEGDGNDGDSSSNYQSGVKKDASKVGNKSSKKKKKHGGHGGSHHKAFRNTKGQEIFSRASPLPSDFEEEEVITHVVGKKPLLGKVWRDRSRGDYSRYRCYIHGIEYKPGEAVYIESQRPEQPYYICCIQDLKMSKRDTLMVHIKWFYRTNEVPEQVYQLLIQDRNTEHHNYNKLQARKRRNGELDEDSSTSAAGSSSTPTTSTTTASSSSTTTTTSGKAKSKRLDERMLRMRELFISDATDVYPVSVLRGKCSVHHCQDIKAVREFEPNKDTFFYTLSYNPETRRLASTQGEIRVGASHQANLPEYLPDVSIEERERACHYGEDLMWEPGHIHDHDLLMYLRAARSMTAFAAMCDGGSPEDGFTAASRDGITANAIQVLHESEYNTGKSLQALLKCPYPASADVIKTLWSEEEIKDFIKGLRTYGKNFFKIKVEFLPEREVSELVEFYYFWKKTPGAANNRPRGRRHRPNVMRRIKPGKTAVVTGSTGLGLVKEKEHKTKRDSDDPSSTSEAELSGGEENGEPSPYYCRHCFTTDSKGWHHAGKEKILVCTDCRIYFKCYGEFPCLDPPGQRSPTPDPVSNDEGLDFDDEDMDEDVKPLELRAAAAKLLGGELNLSAIERDSDLPVNNDLDVDMNASRGSFANVSGPVEIKAELTADKSFGLVSPVPTMATPPHQPQIQSPSRSSHHNPSSHQHQQQQQQQHYRRSLGQPTLNSPSALMAQAGLSQHHPLSLVTNNEIQVLAENFSMRQPQHQSQSYQSMQQQQMSPSSRSNPSPQYPPTPREPTPPPKPDSTECHRSQSAIFTRNWNRGEGNSCARTDLYFKPVPDSKLARKREDRIRRATADREQEALKAAISAAQANDAKLARLEMAAHHQNSLGPPQPHGPQFFGDPYAQHAAALASLQFSAHQSAQSPMGAAQAMERLERERREQLWADLSSTSNLERSQFSFHQEMRVSMALAMSIASSPLTVTSSMRSPLGHYGPPPGFTAHQANILAAAAAAEGRRLEELAALSRERQYAALATDPLVRLQMAGVNPELLSVHHASYGLLGPPPGLGPPGGGVQRGPQTPGPGSYADPRFRSPAGSDSLMRPGALSSPGMEMLQRQLMMEREQSIRAAHGAAQASFFAQQEELIRYEQERARHAAAVQAASRQQ